MEDIRFLIITGLSGAGKTQAVRSLEDLGYFCVDNLPPSLIPKFAELCGQSLTVQKVALVIDIRGGQFFDDLFAALEALKIMGIYYEILFLEASNEVLVNRFKETRRRHPLSAEGGGVMEGIKLEREMLQDLRGRANKIIDTSDLKPNQLQEEIRGLWGKNVKEKILSIIVMSFGYKYGIPLDTDLLVDVRFLPNPYYIPELKPLTGNDAEIQEFVLKSPRSQEFMVKYYDLLSFLIPNYISEGKTHLVIAIGCTGGRHRSVTLANELGTLLRNDKYQVTIKHRDIEKQGAMC